jgi:(2R)-sulfolactate sulfo-lyase subunit beta
MLTYHINRERNRSCPTVGNMYDKLIPKGIYGVFGETSEITGAEHICRERAIDKKVGEKW